MLRNKGAFIIDADVLAREVVEPGQPAWAEIVARFGPSVVDAAGRLNRHALAEKAFADPLVRRFLENATHPRIKLRTEEELLRARELGYAVAVLDAPLLFEAGWQERVDEVWVVYVPADIQLARLMQRDNLTLDTAKLRVATQMDLAAKASQATVVIDNSNGLLSTECQVNKAWLAVQQKIKGKGKDAG